MNLDDDGRRLYDDYRHAKTQADAYRRLADRARTELLGLLDDDDEARIDDELVATARTVESRRVDLPKLREQHPQLAEEFTVTTAARVLRLVTPVDA